MAAVIFDEFHERSLSSDTALALTLEAQDVIRPDLRLIIMSATIDAEGLCAGIDASHLHSEGRMHQVEIVYGSDLFSVCLPVCTLSIKSALEFPVCAN
ncbi:MAG: hypothetical protein K2N19_03885 [Muribaculaceae bacterium]|nr:hypothetical protein [Muribaculaceae bacterium]